MSLSADVIKNGRQITLMGGKENEFIRKGTNESPILCSR